MNTTDKKELRNALAVVEAIFETVDAIRNDNRERFDSKSERWQESDKGEEASAECDNLDTLADAIEAAKDAFGNFELN